MPTSVQLAASFKILYLNFKMHCRLSLTLIIWCSSCVCFFSWQPSKKIQHDIWWPTATRKKSWTLSAFDLLFQASGLRVVLWAAQARFPLLHLHGSSGSQGTYRQRRLHSDQGFLPGFSCHGGEWISQTFLRWFWVHFSNVAFLSSFIAKRGEMCEKCEHFHNIWCRKMR